MSRIVSATCFATILLLVLQGCPILDPEVPGGEERVVYVDADSGSDAEGDGTAIQPWKSASHALLQVAPHASAVGPFTVILAPGVYAEKLVLHRYVTLTGTDAENPEAVRIAPGVGATAGNLQAGDAVVTAVVGLAGENVLRDLTIALPTGAPDGVALLSVPGATINVENVIFDGNGATESIGVKIASPDSSASTFESCYFRGVHHGVLASNSAASFGRNQFEDISGAAVLAPPPDAKQLGSFLYPSLGSIESCSSSSRNIFFTNTINPPSGSSPEAGPVIDTGVATNEAPELLAQGNTWIGDEFQGALAEGDYDAASRQVGERVSDNVRTDAPSFEADTDEKNLIPITIICTVRNALTDEVIPNALVSIGVGPDSTTLEDGVAVFTVASPGLFTFTTSAEGFATGIDCAVISANELIAVVELLLTPSG